ncbi:MAG TPA: hypothetical protein DCE43_13745 [Planctomycetaceae bacterium]|nr:hypothetical protein [Planctomycetaceae bacterium]
MEVGVSSVIVLEQSGRFFRELKTEWSRQAVSGGGVGEIDDIESAGSVPEVFALADASRRGVVVADLAAGQPDVLRLLEGWDRVWPIVVIGSPDTGELEWPLRELGATTVLFEPVTPSRLLAMCQRVLKNVT